MALERGSIANKDINCKPLATESVAFVDFVYLVCPLALPPLPFFSLSLSLFSYCYCLLPLSSNTLPTLPRSYLVTLGFVFALSFHFNTYKFTFLNVFYI